MSKVSIIVPVYKVEPYLHACVDSILGQSYQNIQLILVDDESPDNCGAICDEYARKDSRVKAFHKENGGVSSARNFGLPYAEGEYITFCDSDDMYMPDWIENLVKAIEDFQADLVLGNYRRIPEDDSLGSSSHHETGVIDVTEPESKIRYCFDKVFSGKHAWEVCDRLFRTDIIQKYNLRFCETCENFAEDLGFTLSYSLFANRIVSIETAGYLYRIRSGSMMQSSVDQAKLNSVNEVFLGFEPVCRCALSQKLAEKVLPIFHFLIMYEQYIVVIKYGEYYKMTDAVAQIRRSKDWEKWVKQLFKRKKELICYFGKYNSERILLLMRFCLHRNGFRYRVERRLFYMLKNKMEDCYGNDE